MNKTGIWVVVIIIVALGLYVWWAQVQTAKNGMESNNMATTTDQTAGNTPVAVGSVSRKGFTSSVIAGISDASSFSALLSATGIDATLKGTGPYTVFVPINAAFDHADPSVLNVTGDARKRLVNYHIIEGKAIDPSALTSGTETALSGDTLNLVTSPLDRVARVNGALILSSYSTSNGVVYLINEVLIPPAAMTQGQGQ
jgi:uncharacterized surface protein with fasciclin (FAS1) repeats